MSEVPIIKNPYRLSKPEVDLKDFEPQYKTMGITPLQVPGEPLELDNSKRFSLPNVGVISNDAQLEFNYIEQSAPSTSHVEDKISGLTNNDDLYYLFVDSEFMKSGSLQEIQQLASELIFGEHELTSVKQISANNIVVFKKIPLKIGVFLDE